MSAMKKAIIPTDSELEILQVIWNKGPCTVRDVHTVLSASKTSGYTTTLKLMQIMADKGILERNTSQRTHIYKSVIRKSETQKSMLSSFIESAFGGSASSLVLQALGSQQTNKEELEEIKALIDKIENEES